MSNAFRNTLTCGLLVLPMTDRTAQEGMQQPVLHWTPSLAPAPTSEPASSKAQGAKGDQTPRRGSSTMKVAPWPGALSTRSDPPWRSVISREM